MHPALPVRRLISAFLVFSLLALSPGPGAMAAAVAVVTQSPVSPVVLGAGAAGAAPLTAPQGSALGLSPQNGAVLGSALLLPALPAIASPSDAHSVPAADPAAYRFAAPAPIAARAIAKAAPAAPTAPAAAAIRATRNSAPGVAESSTILPEARRAAVSRRVSELLDAFALKDAADAAPAPAPPAVLNNGAQFSGRSAPAAELGKPGIAPTPDAVVPAPRTFGVGRVANLFIAAGGLVWIGVSAMDLVGPTLAEKLYGDFSIMGVMFSAGSILGQSLAPWVISHLGIKRAYTGSLGIGIGAGLLFAGAFLTGHLSYPLMLFSYFGYSVAHGFWWNSTDSIAPTLVGRDRGKLERFWGWDLFVCDILGVAMSVATGALVASHGFLPILILFPISFGLALLVAIKGFRPLADQLRARRDLVAAGHRRGFWRTLRHGARIVFRNPSLRPTYWAYVLFMMLTPLVYQTLAPGYGLAVLGSANPEQATGIAGLISGLYGLGGLLAGAWMMLRGKRLARQKAALAKASPDRAFQFEEAALHKSLSHWMLLGALGLAALGLMAIPLPHLGALVTLPGWLSWLSFLTLPALAIAPFALFQNVLLLKLRSRYQGLVGSDDDMPAAMSFLGVSAMAASGLLLLGAKLLFDAVSGFAPFVYMALALIPLAIAILALRSRLAAPQRAGPPPVRSR